MLEIKKKFDRVKLRQSYTRQGISLLTPGAYHLVFLFGLVSVVHYDFIVGNLINGHSDYRGIYFPFRRWFLESLVQGEFPFWNPYWGLGEPAVIWATIPIDWYSLVELIVGSEYQFFAVAQGLAFTIAVYLVLSKLLANRDLALLGTVFFYLSPLVFFWSFQPIKLNIFLAHFIAFVFMIRWSESGRNGYLLFGMWALVFGMFGTKLEFWMMGSMFLSFVMLLNFRIFGLGGSRKIISALAILLLPLLVHAWQINLITQSVIQSSRLYIDRGLHHVFSVDLYQNLWLSLTDTGFAVVAVVTTLGYWGLSGRFSKKISYLLLTASFVILGIGLTSTALSLTVQKSIIVGAILATVIKCVRISRVRALQSPGYSSLVSRRLLETKKQAALAWVLFLLPYYFWSHPQTNYDESYLLSVAPSGFKAVWAFFIWMGCYCFRENRYIRVAYISICFVLVMENQGQILLSYLFGLLWFEGRDGYLLEICFVVIAVIGAQVEYRNRKWLVRLAPVLLVLAHAQDIHYVLPDKHIPNYANPLRFQGTGNYERPERRDLLNVLREYDINTPDRVFYPDIDSGPTPLGFGTFLESRISNIASYSSTIPKGYHQVINVVQNEKFSPKGAFSYPSVFSSKTISRLPSLEREKSGDRQELANANQRAYGETVWALPAANLELLNLLGVSAVISKSAVVLRSLDGNMASNLPSESASLSDGLFVISEALDPLPRAFLITNLSSQQMEEITTNSGQPTQVNQSIRMLLQNRADIEKVDMIATNPNSYFVDIVSQSSGLLVISDLSHDYWHATINGSRVEIDSVFGGLTGVIIPGGPVRVDFFCKVPGLTAASIVSVFSLLALLGSTFFFFRKRQ